MKKRNNILLALTLVCCSLCGCKSIQYVPVETIKTDSIYISKVLVDSVYTRDSVYLEAKGDTIFKQEFKYIYKYKSLVDTIYSIQVDSIRVPFPVEKQLSRWEKIKLDMGGVAIGGISCAVIGFILTMWIRRNKGK